MFKGTIFILLLSQLFLAQTFAAVLTEGFTAGDLKIYNSMQELYSGNEQDSTLKVTKDSEFTLFEIGALDAVSKFKNGIALYLISANPLKVCPKNRPMIISNHIGANNGDDLAVIIMDGSSQPADVYQGSVGSCDESEKEEIRSSAHVLRPDANGEIAALVMVPKGFNLLVRKLLE